MDKFDFKSLEKQTEAIADSGDFRSGFSSIFNPAKKTENGKPAVDTVPQSDPEVLKLQLEKEIAQSKAKGFEEGYAKGYSDAKSAADEVNKQVEIGVKSLADGLSQLMAEKQLQYERDATEVADIVVRVAKKITETELANNAVEAVERVIKKSFDMLFDEPQIIVTVSSHIFEGLSEKFIALAKLEGFKGKVEIVPDDRLSIASSRIEWQGGGLCSDKEDAWREIEKLAKECLGKKRARAKAP